jgi:hypothetical protein
MRVQSARGNLWLAPRSSLEVTNDETARLKRAFCTDLRATIAIA